MDRPESSGSADRRIESVDDFLQHFGVKGMKWGVRKQKNEGQKLGKLVLEHEFKTGDKLSIYQSPPGFIPRTLSRISPSYKKSVDNYPQFSFRDKSGTKVGTGAFVRESKNSLYLDWIGVKTKHRGKGYATAAMKGVIKYAQNENITKLKLDVPGNALDAQHIYEKLGFKRNNKNDVVEGNPAASLYGMEMDVPQLKHADSKTNSWESDFANEFAELLIKQFGSEVGHMDSVEDFLQHFGVKGMKWGKRKNPASSDAAASKNIRTTAKKKGIHTVSNKELQQAIERMRLEQDFKRLKTNEKPAVTRWISSTLLEFGKREVQARVAKKIARKAVGA